MILSDKLNLVFQPIGLISASLVLISIIGLTIINKDLANRMTVRLIAAIAFADILAHIGEIYASANEWLTPGSQLCTMVNGFRVISRYFYCFTNIAICLHLYRSLVLLKKSTWRFEIYTWIVTVFMATVFALIYWSMGTFSGALSKKACVPGTDNIAFNRVMTLLSSFIDLLTASIGIITTIVGHRSLNKYINAFSATLTEQGENQDILIKERRKMAARSFLYPLSTCITLPFEAIFLISVGLDRFVMQLAILKNVTLGIAGLLTGIAYAVDPATHSAFRSAYYQVKSRYYPNKEIDDYQYKEPFDISLNATK